MGTVRALTGDRLLMEDAEGTPVRVVATEGEERDQVHRLYILAPLPVPER